ncbi:MAG TPA: AAA family ATPase, partial [Ktedonobacteraceae bacterium]|nr:AAA family ATPase [Ktedonobacteraceae bacterium]
LPLVGREAELQAIYTVLDTVVLNKPTGAHALTISGEMGVGKTRLLAEMQQAARERGFFVLEGTAYEAGRMFPYFPCIEALRPVLRSSSRQQLYRYLGLHTHELTTLAEANAGEISLTGIPMVTSLARLFPELPKQLGVTIEPEILAPEQEKFRLFDSIAMLLERIALEQPLLLSIDNLQWADSATLELTLYLTIRLRASQVALVGVTRPPGGFHKQPGIADLAVSMRAAAAAAKALNDLMRQGLLLVLPLGPLSEDDMTKYLHALLPGAISEELAHSLLSRAGGNIFFLEELVRMLALNEQVALRDGVWKATAASDRQLPESITLAVEQRLQGLSAECQELLYVASLFGHAFSQPVLTRVFQQSEEQIQLLLNEARKAMVIESISLASSGDIGHRQAVALTGYKFCQGIVQEVLQDEVPAQRAQMLHGAIGHALETGYGATAPAHCAELARHYVLSGDQEQALHWSLLAGEDAIRQQAHREAIAHLRVALELLRAVTQPDPRQKALLTIQTHLAIGESWFKLGELEQACSAFQSALEQFQQETEYAHAFPLLLAKANRLLADALRMQGKYDLALAHLRAAQNAFDARKEANERADASFAVPWIQGRNFANAAHVLSPERITVNERLLLLQAQAILDLFLNRGKEAETALWQSHQLATEIGDRGSQAFALHFIGWIRGWGEHIFEAIRLLKQACDLYIAVGDPFRAALGEQGLGIIYLTLGEMEQARLYTERGFQRARRYGVRYILGWLYWNAGEIALTCGDWATCESQLQQAMQEAEEQNNVRLKPVVMQAQAQLRFRQGHWDEAEQLFQAAVQVASNTEWYPSTLALYGHFLAVTGRRGKAAARTQLDRAADFPEPIGFSGHFYIPFLAEGYLHIEADSRAATYSERIRTLRGFIHYGQSVDRILGEVAALKGDWEAAEQAFEDGLTLCRRVNNAPEEAMILYEQARTALMRSRTEQGHSTHALQAMHSLCERARALFLQYGMQRAAGLVDTLQEGVRQLEQRGDGQAQARISLEHVSHPGYTLNLHLTGRELEVLRLVAEGHTDREVAEILVISPRTVNRHLSNIFVKLDVPGRAAAVAYAIRWGLVG